MSNPSASRPCPTPDTGAEVYEALRLQHLHDLQLRVPAHLERLAWPADRLRAEREARFRFLLRHAREHSAWHRERLAHLDLETVGEDHLAQIPPMTKDDLMAHFDEIVTEPRLTLDLVESHLASLTSDAYLLGRYHAVASGGSSGLRGVFVYGWESWADLYLSIARYLLRDRLLDAEHRGTPMIVGAVGAEAPSHATSAVFQTFSNPATAVHRFPVTLPLAQIVAGLNDLQPEYLFGYASVLHELAFEARAGRLRIRPRTILSGVEPLLPEIRRTLEATWRAPVINAWGASEAGGIAVQCVAGPGMHLSDDLLIVEAVDEGGMAVAPGTRSAKIYVTNLFNPVLPLIRYEITDEVTLLDESCPCGSQHRLVGDVQGRHDEGFTYAGRLRVHPHLFRSRLGRERNILEYQVRQTPTGAAVSFCGRGEVDVRALQEDLEEMLHRQGIELPDVSLSLVAQIERTAIGKLKRFVPLAAVQEPG